MIEINLLPGAGNKKASRRQGVDFGALTAGLSGRFKDKFLVGAVVAVVVALGAVGYLYESQERLASSLDDRVGKATSDSTRYANFLKARYKAEAVRDTLLRQVNIIHSIDEDRYVWPHVMDEVSRALPQYTWLTILTYTGTPQGSSNVVALPKTPKDTAKNKPPKRLDTDVPLDPISVRLTGQTVDIEALTRYMKDLEASPYFANVLLDHSEPLIVSGKEVVQFQLTMTYSRPDTLQIHRVPLSLSLK
ncbi:MAG TPA: PilN domain-containing protein [Gemmatimonadaceae bacterium]|nr:PilN domain-containing protein [Gemmatimonadaceae bacterium]